MNDRPSPAAVIEPRRALISVSDKTGVVEFARCLCERGIEILSTGGTAEILSEAQIPVRLISDYTAFPEMMGGRLKTLHPKVHGGILGREPLDQQAMDEHGIVPIDIVAVNLYPFEAVSREHAADEELVIEHIDIGGPAMLRSAAKNFDRTCVIIDPEDYAAVIGQLESTGGTSLDTRRRLALKAFDRTARYDTAIARYMSTPAASGQPSSDCPPLLTLSYVKRLDMRYGENPHQSAAFYVPLQGKPGWLAQSRMLQGKALSFNNVADADAAYHCVLEFDEPACVIIKHATPCGAACAAEVEQAYQLAYRTDPASAFGGIIALNRPLDAGTARQIVENQFVEVILAPEAEAAAREVIAAKPNIRLLTVGLQAVDRPPVIASAGGGLLVQQSDRELTADGKVTIVTQRQPSEAEAADLYFAWKVAKHVKSNAIVYAKDSATLGIGAGQMSRVDSARIAALKAHDAALDIADSVMASDAFFPFRDSIDVAAKNGIAAVVQPGGSRHDDEVVAAADEYGMAMMFTSMRHFRH